MASPHESSTSDYQALLADLCTHNSSIQAGFNAYAQTVKHHSLMLSEVQKEIEEMKQANTKKSAAIEELKQKNKQKLTRISELEDRICELEGNNDQQQVEVQGNLDEGPSTQSATESALEVQNTLLKDMAEEKEDEITQLKKEKARLIAGKTEVRARTKYTGELGSKDWSRTGGSRIAALAKGTTEEEQSRLDCGLCSAARYGEVEEAKALIAKGAELEAAYSYEGRTTLILAVVNCQLPMVELLIANGANTAATDCNGTTALIMAASRGYFEIVEVLIANKANVDAGTIHGVTPLMLAAWRDYVDIVKALMAAGARVNIRDNHKRTALAYAEDRDQKRIMKMLKAAGATT